MRSAKECALELFCNGCNCGQAVLSVFCETYGVTHETALRLACGLGGGFRSGELCGAAAAAAMVIGLKYGNRNLEEMEQKQECYRLTKEFMAEFKAAAGGLACRDILAKNRQLGQKCDIIVAKTVDLLESKGY